jgi:hypothetical protein
MRTSTIPSPKTPNVEGYSLCFADVLDSAFASSMTMFGDVGDSGGNKET